jgi:hypothetical protein
MPKNKVPFKKPTTIDLDKLDQFASKVEEVTETKLPPRVAKIPKDLLPWKRPGVRTDVIKGMGVPLSEPHLLKLQFIAKHTNFSQRKFCQEKLEKAIDREVNAILKALDSGRLYWHEPD